MFSFRTDTDGWKEKICFSLTLSHVVGTEGIDALPVATAETHARPARRV